MAGSGDFGARIADAQVNLGDFKSIPWMPEIGIRGDEELAFAAPYDPQLLAALQAFALLFVRSVNCVWVHLAAEMQAGKTGVISTLARLILANAVRLHFATDRIFVVTGMSDEAWHNQTAPRMPYILRENLHHGGTLSQVAAKLTFLARGETLKNIMIFIDESHYATGAANQPAKHIYNTVARLCPREKWAENNIRFMTISATDPAKVIAMKSSEVPCKVVRLYTTEAYQSVEKLQACGRIRYLEQIPESGILHTRTGFKALVTAVKELEKVHGPLIHVLRPQNAKGDVVEHQLHERFPGAIVHLWDVASNKKKLRATKDSSSSSVASASEINKAILDIEPKATTFVILKGMFRAAKTLNDRYVGVLYDRPAAGDATNLQSLLGRACGYGKSTRTIVFTSQSTVSNYLRCWRELCASKDWEATEDDDVTKLGGKMPHTKAVTTVDGGKKLVTSASHATPLGNGIGRATEEELAASARATYDDADYKVEWSEEFATLEALKAAKITKGRMPEMDEDGFYKNAAGGKSPMSRAQLMAYKTGKLTAQMRGKLEVDGVSKRTYPFYENPAKPKTLRFVVRTLTRLR